MFRLIETDWPDIGVAVQPPPPSAQSLLRRLDRAREAMERSGFTHLLVYADREHYANLLWLTHFDPRFEEALLILRPHGAPLMLVGNECEAYLKISPLLGEGLLRFEVLADLSLMDQPGRDSERTFEHILREEGIEAGARVGCVGWKTYRSAAAIDLPAYLVDAVRAAGATAENATGLLASADAGLRTSATAEEIAYFEYTNTKASEAMRRMIFGLREGMTDRDVVALAGYDGLPLAAHMSCKTGPKRISLASASGARVELGQPWSANVCYWGANICRAGWVARSASDLPAAAQDYIEAFAGPYFAAMAAWLDRLRVGTMGGELHEIIHSRLPFEKYGIVLNAGHLIHYDEWLSSLVYRGSTIPIRSGMVMQTDVIPASAIYSSTRMEDGVAIADSDLRADLARQFAQVWSRMERRREFARNTLGLPVPDDVLPLSNTFGIIPPWLLAPRVMLAVA